MSLKYLEIDKIPFLNILPTYKINYWNMADEKYYTIEEAKKIGESYIQEQAEILRKNLQEKKEQNKEMSYV